MGDDLISVYCRVEANDKSSLVTPTEGIWKRSASTTSLGGRLELDKMDPRGGGFFRYEMISE